MVRISHVDCYTFHCDTLEFGGFGGDVLQDNIIDPVIDAIKDSAGTAEPLLTYEDIGGEHPGLTTHVSDLTAHPSHTNVSLTVTKSNEVTFTEKLEGVLTKKEAIVTFEFLPLEINSILAEAVFQLTTEAIPVEYRPIANTTCYGVLVERDDIDGFVIKIDINTSGVITIKGHALIEDEWVFTASENLFLINGTLSWKTTPPAP